MNFGHIGSDNGLLPGEHAAISQANADLPFMIPQGWF